MNVKSHAATNSESRLPGFGATLAGNETSMSDPAFWHRLQFAFTITYHYLFPQLTMGLVWFLVFWKWRALRTGDGAGVGGALRTGGGALRTGGGALRTGDGG